MPDRSRLRLVVLGVLIFSLVATLLGRLWYLQVLDAPQLTQEALSQQVHDVVTPAPRGEILDDTGKPLVDNKPALVVSVDRTTLDRLPADEESVILHRLAAKLGTPYWELNDETSPCVYTSTHTAKGTEVTAAPAGTPWFAAPFTPCNNGLAYQPVVVSQLKPTLAAARKALQIEEEPEAYPGVTVNLTAVRNYPEPDGAYASSMLGYLGPISAKALKALPADEQQVYQNAQVGATGLEAEYQRYLAGKPGVKSVSVDHLGGVLGTVKNTPPVPGDDVVTNIDAGVQATLEKQLQAAITSARSSGYVADYAAGVVLNIRNGGVVAMASEPTYPPNTFSPSVKAKVYERLKHEEGSPLVDKAFESVNPPGSTFKLISSSGLLHDGMLSTGGSYDCPTYFQGHHNFDIEEGKGFISLATALIVSCDTFFFERGADDWSRDAQLISEHKKPIEGVQAMARDYGIGVPPRIDLPSNEVADGQIGDRASTKANWERYKHDYCEGAKNPSYSASHRAFDEYFCTSGYIFEQGDQENEDIGQGSVTVSPLQLAVAYGAMANGGTVFEPRIAKAIVSPTGKLIKRIKAPVRDHLPLTQEQIDYLRNAFYGVTTASDGTASSIFAGFPMSKVLVGGKTGTAELSGTSENGSWFASFAGPAGGKPQFVTVIEVDKSDQGAVSAAPFVRTMWERIYGLDGQKALFPNGVPPSKLPKIQIVEAGPHKHKKTVNPSTTPGITPSTTPDTTPSTTPSTTPDTTSASSPPRTTSAAGLVPVLAPERRRLIR
ncbi:MAG TPA: penicillin-binding transpeptidase domain-containing protein [Mycobacteriales bacterium]|nr:penicillin-binding transpeptidase domain-containing protein [Mycobacteriales bacterium]